ncbi:calcium-dependent protein kinase cdpk4a, partial [Cystoisospora suis]
DFLAALLKSRLENEQRLLIHTFHKCDIDRSGAISLDDLRVVLGEERQFRGESLEDLMQDFDVNCNGQIGKTQASL